MANKIFLCLLLVAVFILIVRENMTERPDKLYETTAGQVEMCLSCHKQEKLDPAHDTSSLGCSPCHLGNALAIDKEKAHLGIVKNPGDLRVVERTCGIEGCHATDIHKVKNSLMATNRGILATLLYYWGEAEDQYGDYSIEQLLQGHEPSLALDYFRKLCATCHLWKQKGDLEGFFGQKGGGCTACHSVPNLQAAPQTAKAKSHPLIIKKVPIENCVRCHNRSGRIGISYTGVYESEGYGVPYEDGSLSSDRLPGDRFALRLPPDIHFKKGLACIDCHTRNEIMGNGKRYAHFEEQLEVECETCHRTDDIGITAKNNRLNNVGPSADGTILTTKLDGKIHKIRPPKTGACDYPGHGRLSCQACHSTWVPQCYGCHVKRDMSETHLDKLSLKETPGWWEEGRSYIRYEQPALGVWQERIMPVTPGCQDIVTLLNEQGESETGFNSFTMAAIDPHTTQPGSRSCVDCHASTKTVGLGAGTAWRQDGKWFFRGVDMGVETPSGQTPPMDGYVDINGVPLQKSFRPNLRPFNQSELSRILRVGQCLPCHKQYSDPAFSSYSPDKRCPVFEED